MLIHLTLKNEIRLLFFIYLILKYNIYCIILYFLFQNAYIEYREVKAAQGVKIAAKDLEKAIAGT